MPYAPELEITCYYSNSGESQILAFLQMFGISENLSYNYPLQS